MKWNLTKEAVERVQISHLLSVFEQDESDRTEEDRVYLEWQITTFKEPLMGVLPARFHPYIEDGSLNKPTLAQAVREDYLAWVQEEEQSFKQLVKEAYLCTKETLAGCSKSVQDVLSQNLHDSEVWKIERMDGNVSMTIRCDCFTSMEVVVLVFEDVLGESSEVGVYINHLELQKTNKGFAFRIICENNQEWTIEAKALHARSYFYPVAYGHLYNEGLLQHTTIDAYIKKLNPLEQYTLISKDIKSPITKLLDQAPFIELEIGEVQIRQEGLFVVVNEQQNRLGDDVGVLFSHLFVDHYEDPFEIQRIPLPEEEIEAAIFGNNPILQVRAWHTLQGNPQHFSHIINRIFKKFEHTEQNQMTLLVYVKFFYKASVLTDDIIQKYKELIEIEK